MSRTIASTPDATPRETLAGIRGHAVKAELQAQVPATPLREVAADALDRVMSRKAAAIELGISEGRISHKVKDGSLTLAHLEKWGPTYLAELGMGLVKEFGGAAETPVERAARMIREARALLDRADDAVRAVND